MAIPKVPKHPSSSFDWDKFMQYVIEAYGETKDPSYVFAWPYFKNKKYPEIDKFIRSEYQTVEETEPNTDVSYGYLLKKSEVLSMLRISLVGPYFYLSTILPDGSQNKPEASFSEKDFRLPLIKKLNSYGLIFTCAEVLRKKIPFGESNVSVYSVLYSYEDEPAWAFGCNHD